MIIGDIKDIKGKLEDFNKYNCVVIICRYNGGKSSIATDLIHEYFGEGNTYYITLIDQSKPNFKPRESRLKFNEIVKNKIIIFDELSYDQSLIGRETNLEERRTPLDKIADEENRDVRDYIKKLIENNLVIILSNPYASSNDAYKEINLFKQTEKNILPGNRLFIFVKS